MTATPDYPTLALRRGEERRLRAGHLWVFSNEVDVAKTPLTGFQPGDPVWIVEAGGKPLGTGYVNPSTLIAARQAVVKELHQMGLATIDSSANFVLFSGFKQDAPQLWASLLEEGVLIRDVGLSGYLRVTIGNEAENQLFISALKELI